MPFTATFNGLQDLIIRLESARTLIAPGMVQGIQAAADDTVLLTHDACPVDLEADNGVIPGEEGHLAESFSADPVIETSVGATTQVRTSEPIKYSYVTQGTLDKEPILPVTKQALWWPGAPHPLPSVHGQAANDFATGVPDEVASKGYEYFAPLLDALAQTL